MKGIFPENLEKRKVAQLAQEYTAKGYDVFTELPRYKAPYQIRGCKPDLIAKRGDEIIIIEVKTSDSVKKSKDVITQLAQYAKEVPGARFDLVITNPRPSSSVELGALEAELGTIREGLLSDINEAIKQNRMDSVLLLAVRLLEGMLARLAIRQSVYVPLKQWNLASLSSRLANANVISQSVLEFANKLYRQRNALIHGRDERAVISTEEALDIYQKLNKLTKKWGKIIKIVETTCPVCHKTFNSYLNLARHMVLKDRPDGEHIQYLERFLGKPFVEFGWRSDKKIATALKNYWLKHKKWPD